MDLVHFKASWTCGDSCETPEDHALECSECEAGLQLSLQQLSSQEVLSNWLHVCCHHAEFLQALDEIFSRLEGSGFCTGADNEDLCTAFLLMATYQGLPILAEGMIPDTWLQDQVCNQAVPGTCWTYKSDSAVWENFHDSGRVGLDNKYVRTEMIYITTSSIYKKVSEVWLYS